MIRFHRNHRRKRYFELLFGLFVIIQSGLNLWIFQTFWSTLFIFRMLKLHVL